MYMAIRWMTFRGWIDGKVGSDYPIISGVERATYLQVLGMVISSDLGMSEHIDQVLSSCVVLSICPQDSSEPWPSGPTVTEGYYSKKYCFFGVYLSWIPGGSLPSSMTVPGWSS